ncbi:MAG: TRAP transporter small permease [Betaproteobacteria bacterium]|nr:TRAP transporter small permease [Betaproteobacteria bacterium]
MNEVKGLKPVLSALSTLLAIMVFLLMMITFVDVLGRNLFNLSLPASYEITRLTLGMMVFVALPLVSANDEHVTIGLLNGLFKGRAVRRKQFVISLFVAFLCVVWARELWVQAGSLYQQNERMMFLKVLLAPFVYAMSILTMLTAIIHLAQAWLKLAGRAAAPEVTGV